MLLPSLALLMQLAASPSGRRALPMPPPPAGMHRKDVPMPPPPPGMRVLPAKERDPTAIAAPDAPDDPEVAKEVEAQSAELEELKALEEAALDPGAKPNADLLQSMRRLGYGNPLRHRMQCSFDELDLRDDPGSALPLITDLANFDIGRVKDHYDIPIDMQPLVAQYIQFFRGPGRKWFRHWMARSSRFIPMMQPILEKQGMPKDTVYLAMIESGFSSQAYSWAHAAGPWQFIASTGKQYGLKQDFWVDERRDPVKSTRAAGKYLLTLKAELGHWYLAWAGYNAGGGKLRRMISQRGTTDFWSLSEGKGLAKETKHYVPKLIACALVAKNPEAFGFESSEFDYQPPMTFDEVKLESAADLEVIARAAGTPVEQLQELNPELKRWCTPPASAAQPYLLRVPEGKAEAFTRNFASLGPRERLSFKVHRVRRGDTLSAIAGLYHSAPEAIMRMNGLRTAKALKLNAELVVPVPGNAAVASGKAEAVMEKQAAKARRSGFSAGRPDEEIPAGTGVKKAVAAGPVKSELVGGKTRITYGIQGGDSLWGISQRFNCSVEDLKKWNQLKSAKARLQVGAMLSIWPGEKSASVESRAGTVVAQSRVAMGVPRAGGLRRTHTLSSGETLWSVAQQYGVSVEEIRRWNGLDADGQIQAGQALVVAR